MTSVLPVEIFPGEGVKPSIIHILWLYNIIPLGKILTKLVVPNFWPAYFFCIFFFYKPCKSSHGLFSKTNASTFFPSSLATTLQKQTWRVTYGGKTSLAKDIVQKAVSNKKSPNWSKNNENTYKQPWNYIVKSSIYKHN